MAEGSPQLRQVDFDVDEGAGHRARIGLVVLESDQTLEAEARLVSVDGVNVYHSRIANATEVTPETLTDMLDRLPGAAALLPSEFGLDAIGFGCTSAATLIGEAVVTEALQRSHSGVPTSNPVTAAVAAFDALGAQRIAVITPYTADVTQPVVDHFRDAGLDVVGVSSFLESSDLVVARISEASVADAVRSTVAGQNVDAAFVSCTSLRAFGVIDSLETELGLPVVSSNLALLWHLHRLAGVNDRVENRGRLFRLS